MVYRLTFHQFSTEKFLHSESVLWNPLIAVPFSEIAVFSELNVANGI